MALLHYGPHNVHGLPGFLLQDFYVKEFAEHLQMHLLVKDVDDWWAQIQGKRPPEAALLLIVVLGDQIVRRRRGTGSS